LCFYEYNDCKSNRQLNRRLASVLKAHYHTVMDNKNKQTDKPKVVILHDFSHEQIFAIMKAVKQQVGMDVEVAFAMTTPTSLEWKLSDVVKDVQEEHLYLKENPPK
jgi:ribosomal silencing factor RsfS